MLPSISRPFFHTLAVIVMAVVLFIGIQWGIGAGQGKAQSEAVLTSLSSIHTGLSKFYGDQDRFPSNEEFTDSSESSLVRHYINPWPPMGLAMGNCANNFMYKRISQDHYELSICLLSAQAGYRSGWNTVSETFDSEN